MSRIGAVRDDPRTQENWRAIHVEQQERDTYYRAQERRRKLVEAGVEPHNWDRIDSPYMNEALWHVGNFMADPLLPKGAILVLGGLGGKGKSFAAQCACFAYGGVCVQAIELVRTSNFETNFWAWLESLRVVALDDFGKEQKDAKGEFDGKLFALINGRLNRKTIITTNLGGKAFMARYATGALESLTRRFETHGRFVNFEPTKQELFANA